MRKITPSTLVTCLLIVLLNVFSGQAQSELNRQTHFFSNSQYDFVFNSAFVKSNQPESFHTQKGESISEKVVFQILFRKVASIEKKILEQENAGYHERAEFLRTYFQKHGNFSDDEVFHLKTTASGFVEEFNSVLDKRRTLIKNIKLQQGNLENIDKEKAELTELNNQQNKLYAKYRELLYLSFPQQSANRVTEFLQTFILSKVQKGKKQVSNSKDNDAAFDAEFYYDSSLEFNYGSNFFFAEGFTYYDAYSSVGFNGSCDEEAVCSGANIIADIEGYDGSTIGSFESEDCGGVGYAEFSDFVETNDLQSGNYTIYAEHNGAINFSTNCSTQGWEDSANSSDYVRVELPVPPEISLDVVSGLPGANIATAFRGLHLFGGNQTIQVSGSGVTMTVTPTSPNNIEILQINIQIAENAQRGDHNVTLKVGNITSNVVTFRVGDRSPEITSISETEANDGDNVSVTITGNHFGINPQIQIDGVGVNSNVVGTPTSTQISAIFSVANNTIEGNRNVTVVSQGITGGGFQTIPANSATSNAVIFTVVPIKVTTSKFSLVEKNGEINVSVAVSGFLANAPQKTTKLHLVTPTSGTGDATFDNNTHDLNLTGNINQLVKIKGVTESSQIKNLKFEARINTSPAIKSATSFTVATVKIKRTIIGQPNPTDITNTTITTIVGERIKLTAEIVPSGLTVSSHLWTLPGKTMKDYVVAAGSASSQVVPVDPLNTANVDYVWYDGADGRIVNYKATISGSQLTGKTTFDVKRPVAGFSTVSPSLTTIDSATGNLELHLGIDDYRDAGIQFKINRYEVPNSFSGEKQWVQKVNRTIVATYTDGITGTDSRAGLDDRYPYDVHQGRTYDSPGIQLTPFTYAKYDGNWTTWLMFKPSGSDSAWVPLRAVNWHWLAAAQYSNSIWTIVQKIEPNATGQPMDFDTTEFPIWTVVVPSN
jgi:hypothetical protein